VTEILEEVGCWDGLEILERGGFQVALKVGRTLRWEQSLMFEKMRKGEDGMIGEDLVVWQDLIAQQDLNSGET